MLVKKTNREHNRLIIENNNKNKSVMVPEVMDNFKTRSSAAAEKPRDAAYY